MTERFMKVETETGETIVIARGDTGYCVGIREGPQYASALLTLDQLRSLLALFPELREAPKEK